MIESTSPKKDQESHHDHIQTLLQAQRKRRQELREKKDKMDQETKNPEEKIQVIEDTFNHYYKSISEEIKKLDERKTLQRETLNVLWDSLADLREYYTQVSFSLNSYNQWIFKKKITGLENSIQGLGKKIPRTKFRFRRRKKKLDEMDEEARLAKQKKEKEKLKEIVDSMKGIHDKKNENFVVDAEETKAAGNYKLMNLENCKVEFKGNLNLLFMKNVKNCKISSCPVSNSIMIHEAVDCELDIVGHQIRLHDSFDTLFRVFTTSRLIIEGCKRVKFGEWKEEKHGYEGVQNDMKKIGFEGKKNLWKEVQDFHWIKQEKSPNFELVGIEEKKEKKIGNIDEKYDTLIDHNEDHKKHEEEKVKEENTEEKKLTLADLQLEEGQQMVYDYAKPLNQDEIMKKRDDDMKKKEEELNKKDDEEAEIKEEEKPEVEDDNDDSSEDEI